MCGIAGYVLRQGFASRETVKGMCDAIVHRGPDDEGYYVQGECALGMRRLSIIDLTTGHQPIANEDATLWIVFNGEVYNFGDLVPELTAQGHHFRTRSDTESIVHLFEQHGTAGLSRLRGMFAFALWDARRKSLLLVRDRFGKKPLYYATLPRGIFFGSELKCLREAGVPLDLDPDALRLYFQFGYIPDPWTPYRAIRKLPPGTWLRYSSDGRVEQGSFWEMPVSAPEEPVPDRAAIRDQLRDCFDQSVKMRMISDVPLGAFLSGGIDSSLVVASMAAQSSAPVKTFSIGFREQEFSELQWARQVAERFHTDHHEMVVEPDATSLIARLVHHFDEPFADASAIPTFLVSEFASRFVKVVLTGDGGDEVFGGYWSLLAAPKLERLAALPGVVHGAAAALERVLPYSAYGKNFLHVLGRRTPFGMYLDSNYVPSALRRELLLPDWRLPEQEDFLPRMLRHFTLSDPSASLARQILYFEAKANLPGDMLVKVDRMSMAHSIEARCPMLDHELAAIGFRLPLSWNVQNGRGKRFLAETFGDRIGRDIFDRPKKGFSCPLALWFRGPLREFLNDYLRSQSFRDRGFVSPRFVDTLIAEHERERRDNYPILWMLLVLELWFRQFGSAAASPAAVPAGSGVATL